MDKRVNASTIIEALVSMTLLSIAIMLFSIVISNYLINSNSLKLQMELNEYDRINIDKDQGIDSSVYYLNPESSIAIFTYRQLGNKKDSRWLVLKIKKISVE